MNILCKMPTKPYLRKFAYWLENIPNNKTPIISLKSTGVIPNLIKLQLVGKQDLFPSDFGWVNKEYTDSLQFLVHDYKLNRGKIFLTNRAIFVVNRMMHDLFLEIVLNRAIFQKRIGLNYRDTLRDFCEEVGIEIEIDIAFQTLIKQFNRYKNNKKNAYFDVGSRPASRKSMLV